MANLSNKDVILKLQELGLSSHEASIYLAVLSLGETSAGAIIDAVKLHREQIYRSLRKLVTDGFLTESQKNNVSFFSAIDPSVFVNRSKTNLSLAESLQPYLSSLKSTKQQIIQVWEGEEAIKKQLEDMVNTLNQDDEYLVLGGIGYLTIRNCGLFSKNIDMLSICTYCDNRFFSYRREKSSPGRNYSVIGAAQRN